MNIHEKKGLTDSPICCFNRGKSTKYETCAKLHKFDILYVSRYCIHF